MVVPSIEFLGHLERGLGVSERIRAQEPSFFPVRSGRKSALVFASALFDGKSSGFFHTIILWFFLFHKPIHFTGFFDDMMTVPFESPFNIRFGASSFCHRIIVLHFSNAVFRHHYFF